MAAPYKRGLEYFPKMINFYDDDKIIDLLEEYGPLGTTIYEIILSIIYSNGYYVNLSIDTLARKVTRVLGNKWVKNSQVVVQVIWLLADLGLLDHDLVFQDIITSVGIQKRYYQIAIVQMKRQLYSTEYWLLKDENGHPLGNIPKNPCKFEETQVNSEETQVNSEETPIKQKETKLNNKREGKSDRFIPPTSDEVRAYCLENNYQVNADNFVDFYASKGWMVGKSKMKDWKACVRTWVRRTDTKVVQSQGKVNNFNNFTQRKYDFETMERNLIGNNK